MLTALHTVPARIMRAFIVANTSIDSSYVTGAWRSFLESHTGQRGSIVELEKVWLSENGGVGSETSSLWNTMLVVQGYSTGSLKQRMIAFFTLDTTNPVTFKNVLGVSRIKNAVTKTETGISKIQ